MSSFAGLCHHKPCIMRVCSVEEWGAVLDANSVSEVGLATILGMSDQEGDA